MNPCTAFIGTFVARCLERGFEVSVKLHNTGKEGKDAILFIVWTRNMANSLMVTRKEIELAMFPAVLAVDKANSVNFPEVA